MRSSLGRVVSLAPCASQQALVNRVGGLHLRRADVRRQIGARRDSQNHLLKDLHQLRVSYFARRARTAPVHPAPKKVGLAPGATGLLSLTY